MAKQFGLNSLALYKRVFLTVLCRFAVADAAFQLWHFSHPLRDDCVCVCAWRSQGAVAVASVAAPKLLVTIFHKRRLKIVACCCCCCCCSYCGTYCASCANMSWSTGVAPHHKYSMSLAWLTKKNLVSLANRKECNTCDGEIFDLFGEVRIC